MLLWQDGFNHYGAQNDVSGANDLARLAMLAGPWAEVSGGAGPFIPAFGAGTQQISLKVPNGQVLTNTARRVLPATTLTLFMAARFYMTDLPVTSNITTKPFVFCDNANKALFYLVIFTTGACALYSADGNAPGSPSTPIIQTAGPVFRAGTWTHFECKIHIDPTGGTFELRVDELVVLAGSSMNLGSTAIAQVRIEKSGELTGADVDLYVNDLRLSNAAGSYNNDFEGDMRVVTLFPNTDAPAQGWTPFPRKRFGTGILDATTSTACCLSAAASTQLDLGSAAFTLEGQLRIKAFPTGANKGVIAGKWTESNNQREWQVYLGGPSLEGGNFVFRKSTDGQAGTVVETISFPVAFELNTWYHWALVRNAGEVILYINGVQQGLPVADATTYFASGALFTVAGEIAGDFANMVANTTMPCFMDEIRITPGVARYTTEFTPPVAAFPRNVGGDPSFLSVAYLAGFDNGLQDESSFARLMTQHWIEGADGHGSRPFQNTPNDAPGAFRTIYEHTPIDDNFIQASFLPATGIFTLTAAAANNETVTLGSVTYTYKTTLTGAANEVLRGADNLAALFNLYSAVNHIAGEGTLYGTGTLANPDAAMVQLPGAQVQAVAAVLGTAGNSVVTTEVVANGSWAAATLLGGVNIPGPSEFTVDHPPNDTTQLKALTIWHRTYKTDSGACKVQTSLVGPMGGVRLGADNFIGTNPAYREDIYEVDPDTSLGLTPTTIIGGKVRINRTE